MKKFVVVSIILLLAGMGLALGQAGSCICPNSESCGQTGCQESCTGPCALGTEGASSCAANCPQSSCGSACTGQGSCPINTAPCCGR
ncbi:MAG: hypothetical protein PHS80_08065 [Methanothrix sp.]|nr:hypothetical protein [Methanothrix sp.]MDD4447623.1 hypothetical protein [Methanothrix sp.]